MTALAIQRGVPGARAQQLHDLHHSDDEAAAHVLATWADVLDKGSSATRWSALRSSTGPPSCGCSTVSGSGRPGVVGAAPRTDRPAVLRRVRLDKGLYNRLVAQGSMKRLIDEAQVTAAISNPPADTRPTSAGSARFGSRYRAASWGLGDLRPGGDSFDPDPQR